VKFDIENFCENLSRNTSNLLKIGGKKLGTFHTCFVILAGTRVAQQYREGTALLPCQRFQMLVLFWQQRRHVNCTNRRMLQICSTSRLRYVLRNASLGNFVVVRTS